MEDLRRDKDDWICRSTGVTLVFLISIDEDYTTLRRHQRPGGFQVRLGSLITLFRRQNGIPSENHYDTGAIQTANDTLMQLLRRLSSLTGLAHCLAISKYGNVLGTPARYADIQW